jgi:hypothetical protein
MRATNAVHGVFSKLASTMAALRRRSNFICEDCERSARCGLPPSDRCIVRAAQIARGDWKLRRRARALSRW